MKVIAKSIDMVVWFNEKGEPNPIRFRVTKEDSSFKVIKVDKVLYKEEEKLAGNKMIVFRCQSIIDGVDKVYEIKYELSTCKWILFKM